MKKILIMAFLVSLSALSSAESTKSKDKMFNYNFVEADYVDIDNDNLDGHRGGIDMDGLRINGSFDVAPSFSVIGSLLDSGDNNLDLTVLTLGVAYHQPLPRIDLMPFDLVVRAEIEHVELDFDNWGIHANDKENGLLLSGGLQLAIIDKLHLFSDLSLSSNDYYRDSSLSVGARFEFVTALQATAAIELGDIDLLSIGLRYSF